MPTSFKLESKAQTANPPAQEEPANLGAENTRTDYFSKLFGDADDIRLRIHSAQDLCSFLDARVATCSADSAFLMPWERSVVGTL